MQAWQNGFRVAAEDFAWGTTLATARQRLAGRVRESGRGFLVATCEHAFGAPADAALLQAPAEDRPVMRVEWTLLPTGRTAPEPGHWLTPLQQQFGPCTSCEHPDLSPYGDPAWGNRIYAAWQRPAQTLTLSVYGGLRQMPQGVQAGCIVLEWTDEAAASAPFIGAWQRRNAALTAAADSAEALRRFELDTEQLFAAWPYPASPTRPLNADRRTRRQQGLSLRHPAVLETPAAIAAKLGPRSIALWRSAGAALWCASNLHDSVAFPLGEAVDVDWLETLPAKGSGAQRLIIGDWSALAYARPRDIAAAAEHAGGFAGVRLRRSQDYDC